MNLRRRLEMLEKELMGDEPIILHMPHGSTETIPNTSDYMLDLGMRAARGERSRDLELIARSIGATEPGGAHMMELVRIFLKQPENEGGA
jgi:hypothetical protein